jgi:hypothetical protein
MPSEYADLAKTLLANPSAGKMLKNLDKISTLLNSPEGKSLLSQLSAGGGDALKKAAADAAAGNKDSGKALLSSLMADPEGAALVSKVVSLAKEG